MPNFGFTNSIEANVMFGDGEGSKSMVEFMETD